MESTASIELSEEATEQNNIDDLVRKRIEALRPKLLDLTRRNPLISTRFSERSSSIIRIVDEVPELLLESLSSDAMRMVPLPDLGIDPKDEQTREFQASLSEARVNDNFYLEELDRIDEKADDALDLLAHADRALKDRVREKLEMSPRQTKSNLSLQKHAQNNGISPHYELPNEKSTNSDGRHTDEDIQTLLLPDVLERKLNALYSKERTWKEETGISVLQMAYGFLEWEDGNNSTSQFSPLFLVPTKLEKKRTPIGPEFWVESDIEEGLENKILAEKLRLDLNILLPVYSGQGLEKFFKEVEEQKPHNIKWRVRRWGALGVFPSARLAMYEDLAPNNWDFSLSNTISTLFGGAETGGDELPFGDEYHTDDPTIEAKVPCLIADADSSQFSAMVDIMEGKSLAVEGPPGTGKSQTIVNTIANCLAAGKKVLFIAEKGAALDVVRSRLEACGVGEFILPLQAKRSGKEQVMSSIRERMEMTAPESPAELGSEYNKFKEARDALQVYVNILSSKYADTDLTVHTVLARSIKHSALINKLPNKLAGLQLPSTSSMTLEQIEAIVEACKQLEVLQEELDNSSCWTAVRKSNIDPFKAEEILGVASKAADEYEVLSDYVQEIFQSGFVCEDSSEKLLTLKNVVDKTHIETSKEALFVLNNIALGENLEELSNYIDKLSLYKIETEKHGSVFKINDHQELLYKLTALKAIVEKHKLSSVSENILDELLAKNKGALESAKKIQNLFSESDELKAVALNLNVGEFISAIELAKSLSRLTLSVRKVALDEPLMQSAIIDQAKELGWLTNEKDIIEELFFSSHDIEKKLITKYSATISSSNIFSVFSPSYREAKKFYRSISRKAKYIKSNAIEDLWSLDKWLTRKDEFSNSKILKDILGIHLNGLETNIKPYVEAVHFYQNVDAKYSGTKYIALKKFLKFGTTEVLESLPSIEETHGVRELKDLKVSNIDEVLHKLTEACKECLADISKLQDLKKIFSCPEGLKDKDVLLQLHSVQQLIVLKDLLNSDLNIRILLGDIFDGCSTNEDTLIELYNFGDALSRLPREETLKFLKLLENKETTNLEQAIDAAIKSNEKAIEELFQLSEMIGAPPDRIRQSMKLNDFVQFMKTASTDKKGLLAASKFSLAREHLANKGFGEVVDMVLGSSEFSLSKTVDALMARDMARGIYKKHGNILVLYSGKNLNQLRKQLQVADKNVIRLSRNWLRSKLYSSADPPFGTSRGRVSGYTELSLLRHEAAKQQRYIPTRSLSNRASRALLELKPCWMMSPLAVAQYIPKGNIKFDLVIIDEASQMTPEDAIGALVRAKQAMVVGDTNQLPPTGFFRKMLEDDALDEDEKVTEESILEMANMCFRPARRLRWHYRSRNAGLIAFSNKHVYDNDLVIFPSAQESGTDMGVSYKKIEGYYSSGINIIEAKEMVDEIIRFMSASPKRSLGVVLLNKKQSDHLRGEMDYALEHSVAAREYIDHWENYNEGLESFFIKNLENVQGDERDVIFIGTVYGPEEEGAHVMQRFGPINGIGGKRRLNVLFSRAKERIVTFSSMSAADLRAEENGNPGVYMLKCWLEYSASGILEGGSYTHGSTDSDFEDHVIEQIKSIGCEALPQIGVKGYSIDIGVRHPSWPHGYIMGIECDGATYHSSHSARDRDRLRQEVLEGLGWKLYRIWSTDWFEDPIRETKKLREAIEKRVKTLLQKAA